MEKETIDILTNKRRQLVDAFCDFCKSNGNESSEAKNKLNDIISFDEFVLRFFELQYYNEIGCYVVTKDVRG